MRDRSGRIAELDGLRGLAAIAVVIAHYFGEVEHGFRIFTFGWIGVDVFFVLSGFLIGSIILKNMAQPGFLTAFYMRRATRILPIYAVTLGVTFLALALLGAGHAWIDAPLPFVSYATFSQNFAIVANGGAGNGWLTPTWTLAVEEQFYLLAPVALALVPAQRLLGVLLASVACAILFRLTLLLLHDGGMAALVLLPSRLDLFLCGTVAAYLLRTGRLATLCSDQTLRILPLVCAVLLLPIVGFSAVLTQGWADALVPLLLGIGAASYMLAILRGAPEGRHLRSRALGFLGTISYGLYLIHQPVSGLLHGLIRDARPDIGTPGGIAVTLLALAVSTALAWISWRNLEAPLIQFGRRWRYSGSGAPAALPAAAS